MYIFSLRSIATKLLKRPQVQVLSLRPNKDYNFDTISTEVIVLVFYSKALIYKAFLYFESGISVRIKSISILPT